MNRIFVTLLSICFLFCISVPSLSANEGGLSLEKHIYNFLPLKKFSQITELYTSGKLTLEILSQEDIQIINRENILTVFTPHGITSATGSIKISLGTQKVILPFDVHIQKNDTDFSIAEDMLWLSLQEQSLSCESSASSNILSNLIGKQISEQEIISKLPKSLYYNKLPEKHPGGISIWGNPNIGFVGYIDSTENIEAKQKLMTGYGVYEAPIAQVYTSYGFSTQIINKDMYQDILTPKIHLEYILKKLQSGSYIQLWGDWCTQIEYDDGILDSKNDFFTRNIGLRINAKNTCYNVNDKRELKWKYYNKHGTLSEHIGLDGQHAFILLGWKGAINNPSHIRVWDTDTGYHEYPTHEWMRKWKKMDYKSIVISKKE